MAGQTTYSFMDVIATFVHPVAGTFTMNGNQGMGRFVVTNTTERTQISVSADGAPMVSAILASNGAVAIEAQQTSSLHKFLLAWSNILYTGQKLGDVSNWANASVEIRSVLDGSVHILRGVAPSKQPDKTYETIGQNVTWNLLAADVQNF
jgi:hypothetical protein